MASRRQLAAGAVFAGEFRIERRLARGGMADVYVAEQVSTGQLRALKVLDERLADEPRSRARFAQEARVGAQVASEHVVEVVAAGIDSATGAPWLAMELLRGEDLGRALARRGRLSAAVARELFAQLGHALAAAHRAGVVHRDLKPANVFIAAPRLADARLTVKVLDFGIAKLTQQTDGAAASATAAIGSPFWMAPEQCEGGAPITTATDVWALGLLAFMVLTGRSYWRTANLPEAGQMAAMRELLLDPLPAASARAAELGVADYLPRAGFDAWFARCVARETRARFASAEQAGAALDAVLAEAARYDAAEPALPFGVEPTWDDETDFDATGEGAAASGEAATTRGAPWAGAVAPTTASWARGPRSSTEARSPEGPSAEGKSPERASLERTVVDATRDGGATDVPAAAPRRPSRWWLAAAAVPVLALAAGGAWRLRARRGARDTAATRVGPPARVAGPAAWALIRPEIGLGVVVAREGDVASVVTGALRLRVDGARGVEAAATPFAARIVAAARAGEGWLFATADGSVAATPGFLGEPRALGSVPLTGTRRSLPAPSAMPEPSHGRLVVVDAEGAVWSTTGAGAPSRLPLPAGVRAVDATFADARRGALITDGGAVWITDDAGARWREVDLGGASATRLVRATSATGYLLDTTSGPRGVTLAGAAERAAASSALRTSLSPLDAARLRAAQRAAFPESVLVNPTASVVARADGTLLAIESSDLVEYARGASRVVRALTNVTPAAGCVLRPWGAAPVALCGSTGQLYRVGASGAFTPVPNAELGSMSGVALSDDGVHGVALGACEELGVQRALGAPPTRAVCALGAGASSRTTVTLDAPVREVLDAHAAQALVVVGNTNEPRALRRVDLAAGTAAPVALEWPGAAPAGVMHAGFVGDDGDVYAVLARLGDRALAVGDPRRPLAVRPLPPGATSCALRRDGSGAAVGADAAHVWTTADRGASWQPVVVRVQGAPAAIASGPGQVRCNPFGCVTGSVWIAPGPGDALSGAVRPVWTAIAALPPLPPPPTAPPSPETSSTSTLTCTVSATREARRAPITLRGAPPYAVQRQLRGGGAEAAIGVWRTPRGVLTVAAAWRGQLAGAAFAGASRPATLPLPPRDAAASDLSTWRFILRAASARGALIERCPSALGGRCDAWWAARDGGVTQVAELTASTTPGAYSSVSIAESLPLVDGGVLVAAEVRPSVPSSAFIAIELGPDGVVRARRAFVGLALTRTRGLAVVGGATGVAFRRDEGTGIEVQPVRGGAVIPRAVAAPGQRIGVCRGPARAEVDRVAARLGALQLQLELDAQMNVPGARGVLEWSGAPTPCVRQVDAWPERSPAEHESFAVAAEGAAGELVGALGEAGGHRTVRCRTR